MNFGKKEIHEAYLTDSSYKVELLKKEVKLKSILKIFSSGFQILCIYMLNHLTQFIHLQCDSIWHKNTHANGLLSSY
jgi:hypothetical protein